MQRSRTEKFFIHLLEIWSQQIRCGGELPSWAVPDSLGKQPLAQVPSSHPSIYPSNHWSPVPYLSFTGWRPLFKCTSCEHIASWTHFSNQWALGQGTICWPSKSDHGWLWKNQKQMYMPSPWACPTFLLQGSPQEVRRLVSLGHQLKQSLHQHVFQFLLSSPVRGISSCSAKREIAGVQSNMQEPIGNIPSRKI